MARIPATHSVYGPRSTHTVVELEVSKKAYDEIAGKLKAAGYDHAFLANEAIDMTGIALVPIDG